MKIKKIGELELKSKYKNKIISIIIFSSIIFILIVICFVYLYRDNKLEYNNKELSNISQRELEIIKKEKELNKKEVILNNTNSEYVLIEQILKNWINDLNNRNTNIGNYYDNIVNYYSWDNSSRDKVIGDKLSFYKNWDSFNLSISNSDIKQISDDRIECSYDKTINSSNISNGKVYDAKVRSRLIFKKNGNKWLITDEDDLSIYYKNKNW